MLFSEFVHDVVHAGRSRAHLEMKLKNVSMVSNKRLLNVTKTKIKTKYAVNLRGADGKSVKRFNGITFNVVVYILFHTLQDSFLLFQVLFVLLKVDCRLVITADGV